MKTVIRYETTGEETEVIGNHYVVQDHESGTALPTVALEIVDELRNGPAVGLNNDTVTATMTSTGSDLFAGSVNLPLYGGTGEFSSIAGQQRSGNYGVTITFSEESLETVTIIVEIKPCSIGEASAANGTICEPCNGLTYNFLPEGNDGCQPCPEDGRCDNAVIRPKEGYWHPFPCSIRIQKCLTKWACEFDGREHLLHELGTKLSSCNMSEQVEADYKHNQCRQVTQDLVLIFYMFF